MARVEPFDILVDFEEYRRLGVLKGNFPDIENTLKDIARFMRETGKVGRRIPTKGNSWEVVYHTIEDYLERREVKKGSKLLNRQQALDYFYDQVIKHYQNIFKTRMKDEKAAIKLLESAREGARGEYKNKYRRRKNE